MKNSIVKYCGASIVRCLYSLSTSCFNCWIQKGCITSHSRCVLTWTVLLLITVLRIFTDWFQYQRLSIRFYLLLRDRIPRYARVGWYCFTMNGVLSHCTRLSISWSFPWLWVRCLILTLCWRCLIIVVYSTLHLSWYVIKLQLATLVKWHNVTLSRWSWRVRFSRVVITFLLSWRSTRAGMAANGVFAIIMLLNCWWILALLVYMACTEAWKVSRHGSLPWQGSERWTNS
jgi:hypothetical protein